MRTHVRGDVTVHRQVEQVFRWLAEPERAARWQDDVAGYQITHRTAEVVGTEFVETLARRGRSAQLTGRVVSFAPDARIGFALSGEGVQIAVDYVVQPAEAGSLVRADITIDTPGRALGFVRPAIEWQMRRHLRHEFNALRRLCEAEPTAETEEVADG